MRNESSTRRVVATPESIQEAAHILRAGGLVAFPTETVYGLGADATSSEAVAKIYAAKGRPSFNPLIAHVASLAEAQRQGEFNADALRLAQAFWPGPLTLVTPLARGAGVCDLARAGLDTVALRAPAHPLARALIEAAGRPLAAPSANLSGHVSPTTANHVGADLEGKIEFILDGGAAGVGLESTIVACLDGQARLLRPGGLPTSDIERVLGRTLAAPLDGKIAAPGMLASHYAPRARVRLNATGVAADECALDFGGVFADAKCVQRIDLSASQNLVEAAAGLFGALRALDASGAQTIAVAPIPMEGLGEAINDRLARAAADRG